jgi:hypothetical protein
LPLKREYAKQLKDAGFLPFEIREFSHAASPSGEPQDLNKVCNSAPFFSMLESRREWWKTALAPKSEGGWGYTYEMGKKAIENHYKTTKRRKKKRSIFDFLKVEYRPKNKIRTKKAFSEAVINKSKIVRDMGPYSSRLKLKQMKIPASRCRYCRGTGRIMNIEGFSQTCIRCAGTGLAKRKRYM